MGKLKKAFDATKHFLLRTETKTFVRLYGEDTRAVREVSDRDISKLKLPEDIKFFFFFDADVRKGATIEGKDVPKNLKNRSPLHFAVSKLLTKSDFDALGVQERSTLAFVAGTKNTDITHAAFVYDGCYLIGPSSPEIVVDKNALCQLWPEPQPKQIPQQSPKT